MTRRIVGICQNCGDRAHKTGNVFRLMRAWEFEIETRTQHTAPEGCEWVKVCNNCDFPHPYHRRTSAKARRRQALIQELIGEA